MEVYSQLDRGMSGDRREKAHIDAVWASWGKILGQPSGHAGSNRMSGGMATFGLQLPRDAACIGEVVLTNGALQEGACERRISRCWAVPG
jgi:hypothetical protein